MDIHAQAKAYANNADSYARGRPDYPGEMIDWMCRLTQVGTGDVVVDIGAGTGKFTRALVELGCKVTAVEPVDEMRAQLVSLLPEVRAVQGTAEEIGIESLSADLVTCAQSFHWFANATAVGEIARVLKPGCFLILVWNQRDLSHPIQAWLEQFLLDHQDPATPHSPDGRWRAVIDGDARFSLVETVQFSHVQELDREGVCDRMRSMSVFTTLGQSAQELALGTLGELLPERNSVLLPYFNEAFAYKKVS